MTKDTMITLVGEGVAPGLAQGKAFVYRDVLQRDSELYAIDQPQVEREIVRIVDAIDDVRQSLILDAQRMEARLGKQSADIFRAQEAILLDPSVVEELKRTVEVERINAEQVVRTVFRLLARRFRDMSNEMFRERGDDIDDLSRRLLLSLAGTYAHDLENLPTNTVLVARHLLPSDTVFLSRLSTVAVLAEFAGPAAHAALLARELGIPCVGRIPELLETVHTGDVVLVNGDQGTAVINPNSHARRRFERDFDQEQQRRETMARVSRIERAMTLDGVEIAVRANVRSRDDVALAVHYGADGIGLFRTEPFFLSTKHFPSDREFAEFLFDSLHLAQGKYVDVRLLDIGADKNPLYIHLPPEPDPFLGRRGVRVLLEYPELLDAQLRAVLEVSQHFSIGILIPMVTTENDVIQVAQRFHHLADDMSIRTVPRLGAMIETPAAALSIPSLKKHVDFFSIGSNDLTQYTMAAGRENPLVTAYFLDDHPSILRLIELVVRDSGDTPVSLCGEIAGRIDVIPRLLSTGIRSLSVPATLVPDVKDAIKNCNIRMFFPQV
ncbi:MAG: phosphoenolpyruvate--protein phosphotransferase [Candidatus Binatia bacterium]